MLGVCQPFMEGPCNMEMGMEMRRHAGIEVEWCSMVFGKESLSVSLGKSLLFSVSTSIQFQQLPSTSPFRGAISHRPRQASERLQHGRGPEMEEPGARGHVGPRNLPEAHGAADQNSARRLAHDSKRLLGCIVHIVALLVWVTLCASMCHVQWNAHVLSVSLHARRVIAVEEKSERTFIMLLRGPAELAVWTEPDDKHDSRNWKFHRSMNFAGWIRRFDLTCSRPQCSTINYEVSSDECRLLVRSLLGPFAPLGSEFYDHFNVVQWSEHSTPNWCLKIADCHQLPYFPISLKFFCVMITRIQKSLHRNLSICAKDHLAFTGTIHRAELQLRTALGFLARTL